MDWWLYLMLPGMLFFGSFNTLSLKWMGQTCCPTFQPLEEGSVTNCPSGQIQFNKPWSVFLFAGELMLLAVHKLERAYKDRQRLNRGLRHSVSRLDAVAPPVTVFALPAFCDFMCSGLANFALMFVDAPTWQMMRGAILIVTAVLTTTYLKRDLLPYRWVGVSITTIGLLIVGYASVLDSGNQPAGDGSNSSFFGILLVIFAQVFGAFQMVYEEKLLSNKHASAKKTVGLEGFWGLIFVSCLLVILNIIPGDDHGSVSSLPESMFMVTHQPFVLILLISFGFSVGLYAMCGLNVGRRLSAMTRCLVDISRVVVVWAVQLILGYSGYNEYGEHLKEHWWLTVIGFVFLIVGSLTFNSVIKIPHFEYEPTILEVSRDLRNQLKRSPSRAEVIERMPTRLQLEGVPTDPLLAPTKGLFDSEAEEFESLPEIEYENIEQDVTISLRRRLLSYENLEPMGGPPLLGSYNFSPSETRI